MSTIDLTTKPPKPRQRPRVPTAVLALAAGLLLGTLGTNEPVGARAAAPTGHMVVADISTWPATVTATIWRANGRVEASTNWTNIRLVNTVRVAVVAESDQSPIECTITVDGRVAVHESSFLPGHLALCTWAA